MHDHFAGGAPRVAPATDAATNVDLVALERGMEVANDGHVGIGVHDTAAATSQLGEDLREATLVIGPEAVHPLRSGKGESLAAVSAGGSGAPRGRPSSSGVPRHG